MNRAAMEMYLFTVDFCFKDEQGLLVKPGIPLEESSGRPELKQIIQGISLELRRPDGTTRRTCVVNYGISVYRQLDGSYVMDDNPHIHFTLPDDLNESDAPRGTEIWWVKS